MSLIDAHLLTALFVLPLAAAALLLTFPEGEHSGARGLALGTMAATLGLAVRALMRFDLGCAALQLQESHAWIPSLGASYAVGIDGLALCLILLTCAMMPLALGCGIMEGRARGRGFAAQLLLLEATILGALVSVDLLLFYVFWEAMLVPALFLIGAFGGPGREPAGMRFFLYTMAGSMLMLVALVGLGLSAGGDAPPSFLWTDVLARLQAAPLSWGQLGIFAAFALAFAIKVPLVPLHGWIVGAYTEAPVGAVLILSGVMVKVGAFGLIRYALLLLPRVATFVLPTLIGLSVLGILYGALVAMRQPSLKRMLAYSSVSHMGFVVLGLCSMSPDALVGSGTQMLGHAISTGGLFMLVAMLQRRCPSDRLDALGGLSERMPALAALFVFMALSSMGVPGLGSFVGEFLILNGTFSSEGLSLIWSTGAVVQGIMLTIVLLGALVCGGALWALGRWASRAGRGAVPLAALGAGAAVAGTLALVAPPVLGLPMGVALRPMASHALSALPFVPVLPLAAGVALLGVILGACYPLMAISRTFFGPAPAARTAAHPGHGREDLRMSERLLVLPFVVATLVLGLYPAPVLRLLEPTMAAYAAQFRAAAGWPTAPSARAAVQAPTPRARPRGPSHMEGPRP